MFVSLLCYKSGPLKLTGQFSHDGIGCKTPLKFVSNHWSALVSFDLSIVSQSK